MQVSGLKCFFFRFYFTPHFFGFSLNEPVAGYANYSKLIAFSPRNNSNVRILVKTVQTHFELKGFEFDLVERDDAADLDEFLEVKNPFVGIEFSDELKVIKIALNY